MGMSRVKFTADRIWEEAFSMLQVALYSSRVLVGEQGRSQVIIKRIKEIL